MLRHDSMGGPMSWLRHVLVLLATAALLVAPHLLSPSVATQAHSVRAAAPSAVEVRQLIQGVVVDQFGRPVDDVDVFAARPGGERVATAKTYASAWADGPQHGYFYLPLDQAGRGTYVLTISKDGYRTVELGRHEISRRHQKISLGEVEIEKVLPSTTTSASLARSAVTTKDRGAVVVAVATKATKRPGGVVEVREGETVVGTATLKPGNQGAVAVTLAKLGKGGHVLRAYYLGTQDLAPSSSKRPVTLVVTKSRK